MMGTVLVLRTCTADMTSRGGFLWPESGPVEAPDWKPTKECGDGLHGWLWGEGDGSLMIGDDDRKWLVVEVETDTIINLGGKVKFPRGVVVCCGDAAKATAYMQANVCHGRAIIGSTNTGGNGSTNTGGDGSTNTGGYGSTNTGGDGSTNTGGNGSTNTGGNGSTNTGGERSTNTGGERSTNTGGYGSTNTGGNRSTNTGGYGSTNTGGDGSTNTGGERSTNTGGDRSTNTGGYGSTNTGGYRSTNTGGDGSTNTGGDRSIIQVKWWDYAALRYRLAVGYIGENGLKPNTPYRWVDGAWKEVIA